MKVRIVSNGTGFGTTVQNAETGEVLDGVTAVTWSFPDPGEFATAVITIVNVAVEVELEAEIQHHKITVRDVSIGPCRNVPAWNILEGPSPDDYTFACTDHLPDMVSGKTLVVTPYHPKERSETCSHIQHASDCAMNNAPAYVPGSCDCGGLLINVLADPDLLADLLPGAEIASS